MKWAALLVLATALLTTPAAPQPSGTEVRAAIVPESLSVGDVVHAAIRVRLAPGVRVTFPDTLPVSGNVEGAGARTIRSDTTGGSLELTATYPITAWTPGMLQLPSTSVQLLTERGQDTLLVEFPEAQVVSVLPADTSEIEPRPARDVLGGDRVWWPWLAGIAVLLALAALALWAWRRRARPVGEATPAPGMPPRQAALALLDRARTLRLVENGEVKRFYSIVSSALRMYIEAVEAAWSADLTTTELASLLPVERSHETRPALEVLMRADFVKFARARPDSNTALADWSAAREWVERFGPDESTRPEEEVAAS